MAQELKLRVIGEPIGVAVNPFLLTTTFNEEEDLIEEYFLYVTPDGRCLIKKLSYSSDEEYYLTQPTTMSIYTLNLGIEENKGEKLR